MAKAFDVLMAEGLSTRAANCLQDALCFDRGLDNPSLDDVLAYIETDALDRIPNFGRQCQIEAILLARRHGRRAMIDFGARIFEEPKAVIKYRKSIALGRAMLAEQRAGKRLRAIGEERGISGSRVRQCIARAERQNRIEEAGRG